MGSQKAGTALSLHENDMADYDFIFDDWELQEPPAGTWRKATLKPNPPFKWRMCCRCTECGNDIEMQGTSDPPKPGEPVCYACNSKKSTCPPHVRVEHDPAMEAFRRAWRT